MAVAYILDFPGAGAEDYDWVMEKMELGGRLPAGALFHAAGATDAGWRVCDVWESAEAFDGFAQSKIGPLSAQRGMSEPQIRSFEVAEAPRRGSGDGVGFFQIVLIPGLDHAGFVELDRQVVGPERGAPEGCVFHVNGPLGEAYCVLDYWASSEIRDRFVAERIAPAMAAAPMPPAIEGTVAHAALTEPAERPAHA